MLRKNNLSNGSNSPSVALIHNSYMSDSPSGEDVVAEEECLLLTSCGVTVHRYTRSNNELRGANRWTLALTALQAPWSLSTYRSVRRFLERCKPDVVHVHNTFPLISYSLVDACQDARIPCVATLHNYRFACANGLLLRDGRPCEECLKGPSVLPGLHHRCYRQGLAATVPVAVSIAINRARGLWHQKLSAIIALTEFQRALLIRTGVPAHKVVVKPNFVQALNEPLEWSKRAGFLFVGRISHEKGVRLLVDVWKRLGSTAGKLTVIGDGPLRLELQRDCPDTIEFVGKLSREEVWKQMRQSRVLLFPSLCFEGFPLTILEAFSCGLPVVASRLGGIPEIVHDGLLGELVSPGDVGAWCDAISRCSENSRLESMGENAFRMHQSTYSPDRNIEILLGIYQQAMPPDTNVKFGPAQQSEMANCKEVADVYAGS